jgi:hypothetical protein
MWFIKGMGSMTACHHNRVETMSPAILFQSNVEKHTLAKYLMELTLVDFAMVHYRPSEIAAASLCLSQLLLEDLPWV